MSCRSARFERRARARAEVRAVLGAAAPARAEHSGRRRRCVADGCTHLAVPVGVGPVELALCPDHMVALQRRWRLAQSGLRRVPAA